MHSRRTLLCLGTGMAVLLVSVGCRQTPKTCDTCDMSPVVPCAGCETGHDCPTCHSAHGAIYAPHSAPNGGCTDCAPGAPAPAPAPAPAVIPTLPKDLPPVAERLILPEKMDHRPRVSAKVELNDGASVETGSSRRSFGSSSADATYNRAEDHSWLVGRVYYVHGRDTWRLRYASIDEIDPYGGSVTLQGPNLEGRLRDGAQMRVEGELLDPESRHPSPAYRVRSLQNLN